MWIVPLDSFTSDYLLTVFYPVGMSTNMQVNHIPLSLDHLLLDFPVL